MRTTIVIPVWGEYRGRRLDEALASIEAQAHPARTIVVDNAAEPPLAPIPGVEIVRSETRLTAGAARNLGLAAVDTPYVLFWDADDLMCQGILRVLEGRLDGEPRAVAAAGGILEDEPRVPHRWPRRWQRRLAGRRRLFALVNSVWSIYPTTGATLMRTDVVRAAGGFGDASSGEDWSLGASLAFRGGVLFDAAPGRIYRRHGDSLWVRGGTHADLVTNAAAVRARLRADTAVSGAVRGAVPLLGLVQRAAIGLAAVKRA